MSAAGGRRIAAFFEADHDGIDALLAAIDAAEAATAVPLMREFDRRLERHIVWEEEVLFPAADQAAPEVVRSLVLVLRREHARIRARMKRAMVRLRRGDAAGARACVAAAVAVMGEHNRREEGALYPACDGNIPAAEVERILDLLAAASR